jgi:hypothetical protein
MKVNNFTEYNFLCHHGIIGMKWGVRRYQNKDGTLTEAGKIHYGIKKGYTQEELTKKSLYGLGKTLKKTKKSEQRRQIKQSGTENIIKDNRDLNLKYISKIRDTQKELNDKQKEYMSAYNKIRDDIYSDGTKFRKAAKWYADSVIKNERITDTNEQKEVIDFYTREDGFQDDALESYVDYKIGGGKRGNIKTEIKNLVNQRNEALEEYISKLTGTRKIYELSEDFIGEGLYAVKDYLRSANAEELNRLINL